MPVNLNWEHVAVGSAQLQLQAANISAGEAVDLYIKGLPPHMTEFSMNQVFELYCTDPQIFILSQDVNGTLAKLRVGDPFEARWMVENLNGNIPQGLGRPIWVSYASQPRGMLPSGSQAKVPGGFSGSVASGGGFAQTSALPGAGSDVDAATASTAVPGGRGSSRFHPYEREGNANSNIYVWQLPLDSDDSTLLQVFGGVGEIISVKVNPERRYGFVQFKSADEATIAVETINGMQLNGTTLKCKYADRDKGQVSAGRSPPPTVATPDMRNGLMNGLQAPAQAFGAAAANHPVAKKPVDRQMPEKIHPLLMFRG